MDRDKLEELVEMRLKTKTECTREKPCKGCKHLEECRAWRDSSENTVR